jgi:hypothetical protein
MTSKSGNQVQQHTATTNPLSSGILQRQCATCGQHTIAGGECQESQGKHSSIQRHGIVQTAFSSAPSLPLGGRFSYDFTQIPVQSQEQPLIQAVEKPGRVAQQVMSVAEPSHKIIHRKIDPEKNSVPKLAISRGVQLQIQRKPSEVTAYSFMGLDVGGGINPTMQTRLTAVATHLQSRFTTEEGRAPANNQELRQWAGVYSIQGWRQRAGSTSKHCSGSAVDVNYDNQPYIVTRTETNGSTTLGGEAAGRSLTTQRQATVEVFDRAMAFVYGEGTAADVSARKTGEATTAVYSRFRNVSQALSTYLSLAFHTTSNQVTRRPIANIEGATEAELLAAIPTTERKEEAEGIEAIRQYIIDHTTREDAIDDTYHWSWEDSFLAREYYFRMLRDYEHVRIPMLRGNPEARPGNTRNPARGFLHMTEEFVVAMTDVGRLRWGIADLGNTESGDTHHFDLGNHGGVTPDCS